MKIIIVGGGVSGLTTWLYLHKTLPSVQSYTIQIFEAHSPQNAPPTGDANPNSSMLGTLSDSAPVVGNIIGFRPTSMRLIKRIDTRLYELFKARGYLNQHHTFRSARGHKLGMVPARDFEDPPEYTVTHPRYWFWKLLQEVVGQENIQYQRVVDVDLSGYKPVVKLADGRTQEADLVIGADGARSVVRKALFKDDADGKYALEYEGFAGVGSIMDTEIPESVASTKSMVFTFGPTGSFGYCSAAPQQQRVLSWWSNWGTTDLPKGNVMDTEEIRRQLNERHGTWKDPVIQHIIKTMNTDRIYPVWSMPDLPFWGERGAVLIGDAAHALRAMSGQGACQALEDTVTLCLLLQHYVAESNKPDSQVTTKEAIALASKALYKIRSPRTSAIRDKSRRMYVSKAPINNVVLEYLWYLMIHLLLRYSWIGYLIAGLMSKGDDWRAETEVERYLAEKRQ